MATAGIMPRGAIGCTLPQRGLVLFIAHRTPAHVCIASQRDVQRFVTRHAIAVLLPRSQPIACAIGLKGH